VKRPIVYVAGTGRGLPERVLRNDDFVAMGLDTSDEWISSRTGIKERRISGPTDTTCSLAADAARKAMAKAGITAGELDAIVMSTATPDRLLPSTAADLQAEIGASRAAAFDISAACTGFIYATTVAEGLIATGMAETILVVGSERMSSIVDWTDRSTCVLFGDGAGAAVLKRSPAGAKRGLLGAFVRSDGTLADLLYRPAGGAKIPFSSEVLADKSYLVKMAGREVFKHAVREMAEATDRAMDNAKLTANDIDLLIPHQANERIIEATAKHANVSMDKVYVNVDRFGNTSSASVAIALDEAIELGRVHEGMTVMLVAFGAGFTWGSMIIRF
jgi:3-oxoacyl-[acyl-carrier-protein] synthase-3